jgi:4-amino-4-deoxy-L-arabinose transferase-like glycosyltransferase
MGASGAIAIFGVALCLRLLFVLWAPGEPTGDGFFYHLHAVDLVNGNGYVNVDRSPANTWMPGWPATLASLYALFGFEAKVGMVANAFLGALTAALLARLGGLLASRRVGRVAGWLYAVWPGCVYFSATLFNEVLFSFLLISALNLVVDASRSIADRLLRFALAGLALGACALVKAEPLVLLGAVLAYIYASRQSDADFLRAAATTCVVAIAVVLPWTVRNYLVFDRFIPTVAGGGMVVHAANHPGATGGNDLQSIVAYTQRLGVADATQAQQNIAMNDNAWSDFRHFVSDQPGEALRVMASKLRLTYGGDSEGANLVRGFFGKDNWYIGETAWRRLVVVADLFWWAMVLAVAVGLSSLRSWPVASRVLVLGLLATWLGLHLVFMGGMRFHFPETTIFALIAGAGIVRLRDRFAR